MTQSNKLIAAKRVAIAVAAVCASLSAPVHATDSKALLDLMLKKGVITQKDYDEFLEATKEQAENKAFRDQRIDQDVSKAVKFLQKNAPNGFVRPSGTGLETADGNFVLNLTGRLHFDARNNRGDFGEYADRDSGSLSDRFSVRRARLGASGSINKNINYEIVTNLVGSNANLLDTAWANFTPQPEAQIRVGRFKQPFGLETLMSSNNISFMERTYQDQISPGKQLGVMFHGEQPNSLTYAASAYQVGFDPQSSQNNLGPEAAARVTFNLAKAMQGVGDDVLMHFGVAATRGSFDVVPTTSSQSGDNRVTRGAFVAFNDEFGGLRNVYRTRITGMPPCPNPASGTGACTYGGYGLGASEAASVDRALTGLEFALAKGPAKLQSEYTIADYTARSRAYTNTGSLYNTRSAGQVKTYYVEFMYNLTGEPWAPTYRSGVIGGIRPTSVFNLATMSGTGAWQLGLRYSGYDAGDFGANTSASGGSTSVGSPNQYQIEGSPKGNTTTIGLNWILNPNARVMLNYAMTNFDYAFTPVDIGTAAPQAAVRGSKSHAVMLRTQFNF